MSGTKFKVKSFTEATDSNGVIYEFGAEINKDFPIEAPGGASGELVVNNDLDVVGTADVQTKVVAPLIDVDTISPKTGSELTLTNNNDDDTFQVVGLKINDLEHTSSYVLLSEGDAGDGVRFAHSGSALDMLGVGLLNAGAIQGLEDDSVHNVLQFYRSGSAVTLSATNTLSLEGTTEVDVTTSTFDVNATTLDIDATTLDIDATTLDIDATNTNLSGTLKVNTISPVGSGSINTIKITNDGDDSGDKAINLHIVDTANAGASVTVAEIDSSTLTESGETGILMGGRLYYAGADDNRVKLQGATKLYIVDIPYTAYTDVLTFDRDGTDVKLESQDSIDIDASSGSISIDASSGSISLRSEKFTASADGDVYSIGVNLGNTNEDKALKFDGGKFYVGYNGSISNIDNKYAFQVYCPFLDGAYTDSNVITQYAGNAYFVVKSAPSAEATGHTFNWGRDADLSQTATATNLGIEDIVMQLDTKAGNERLTVEGNGAVTGTISQFTGSHIYFSETSIDPGNSVDLIDNKLVLSSSPMSKVCCGIVVECVTVEGLDAGTYSLNSLKIDPPSVGYFVTVASIGDSRTKHNQGLNVCNENGAIEPGDLLVTSSTPGYLMKQSDDIIKSCTVGKAMENVVFNEQGQATGVYGYLYCG